MKKSLLFVLLAASAMMVFANGGQEEEMPESGTTEMTAETINIEFYNYKQESFDNMPALIEAFEAQYPNISIEPIIVPNDENKTLINRAAANDLPEIIQLQSYASVKEFAESGFLLDLTDAPIMEEVLDSAKPSVTLDGRQYALPMDFAGIGIIYNMDIFDELGLAAPTTYSELQAVALTLQDNGYTPFAGLLAENWSIGHFITLVHTSLLGAETVDSFIADMDAGEASYGDAVDFDRVLEIMDFYIGNMASNATEMNWGEQQAAFAEGEAAMMVQGLWSYGAAVETNPELNCGFIPFPVSDDPADTIFYADIDSTLAVSAQASPEEQEAAKTFLSWLNSPEAIKIWTEDIKLTVAFEGADLSGMDSVFVELMDSVGALGAYPWAFSQYPNPTWETAVKGAAQAYAFGQMNKDEVIATIDQSWAEEVAE